MNLKRYYEQFGEIFIGRDIKSPDVSVTFSRKVQAEHYVRTGEVLSESDAARIERKIAYVKRLGESITQLARVLDSLDKLVSVFEGNGYGPGGADEIQAFDISSTGLVPSQVGAMVEVLLNLKKSLNGDDFMTIQSTRTDV